LTGFADYPEEEYDKKIPWYTWLKEQIRRKDAWKRRMEETVRRLFKNRPHVQMHHKDKVAEWFEKAEKEIFGEEIKK